MNRQQIQYIRECLSIRERRLTEQHCGRPSEPSAVEQARQVIKDWESTWTNRSSQNRAAIKRKIRTIEEQLILGGMDQDIASALSSLDSWSPEHDSPP